MDAQSAPLDDATPLLLRRHKNLPNGCLLEIISFGFEADCEQSDTDVHYLGYALYILNILCTRETRTHIHTRIYIYIYMCVCVCVCVCVCLCLCFFRKSYLVNPDNPEFTSLQPRARD